jgi:hypothetical protein
MDLHGHGVGPLHQQRGRNLEGVVIRLGDLPGEGVGEVGQRARGEVVADDLDAVEVDGCAVVAPKAERQRAQGGGIGHHEPSTEVRGLVLVRRIGAVADHRDLPAVAVAQLRCSLSPTGVIEGRRPPRCSLIRTIRQVPPDGTARHQHLGVGLRAHRG